jgi:hypothetical protein
MVEKILKIEKIESPHSNEAELEMHILKDGINVIRLRPEDDDKIYFGNLAKNDKELLDENLNKKTAVIVYNSKEDYKKQLKIPINEKVNYYIKLESWRITN